MFFSLWFLPENFSSSFFFSYKKDIFSYLFHLLFVKKRQIEENFSGSLFTIALISFYFKMFLVSSWSYAIEIIFCYKICLNFFSLFFLRQVNCIFFVCIAWKSFLKFMIIPFSHLMLTHSSHQQSNILDNLFVVLLKEHEKKVEMSQIRIFFFDNKRVFFNEWAPLQLSTIFFLILIKLSAPRKKMTQVHYSVSYMQITNRDA